ncbi:WXG100 family type VII secretion target [Streptomyces sp. NPDC059506]|uniref:WXG100 family type VII secretion target n=1 Tax=Streptomyces sp. NPDC059506 TaxID=3347751 RepID=UPI0036A9ACB3
MSGSEITPSALRNAAGHGTEARNGTQTAMNRLDHSHEGVKGETDGFGFAEVLLSLQKAWHGKLQNVRDECDEVARLLKSSADDYEKNEDENTVAMSTLSAGAGLDGVGTMPVVTAPASPFYVTPGGASGPDPVGTHNPMPVYDPDRSDHYTPGRNRKEWTQEEMENAKPAPMPTYDGDGIGAHQVEHDREWTAEDMQNAKPAPMPAPAPSANPFG